jgi:hypothetical protein
MSKCRHNNQFLSTVMKIKGNRVKFASTIISRVTKINNKKW